MNPPIRAVIRKEFLEYRRNRLILLTMAILPVVFLIIPIVTIVALPDEAPAAVVSGIVGQAMLFFLIVPVMIPTTIAAYTVIGEREQATLEPVLAAPITDRELLIGKALAATGPAVVVSWLLYGLFLLFTALLGTEAVRADTFQIGWLVAQAALAPVVAILSIEVGMAVSARSSDIRVAQQVAGLAMLPVLGLVVAFSYRLIDPTPGFLLLAAAAVAAVDVAGWRVVERMFDRERMLTRYGA